MTEQYKQGWKAHLAGDGLKDCPYPKGSTEARRWCCGWYECRDDPTRAAEAGTEEYLRQRGY